MAEIHDSGRVEPQRLVISQENIVWRSEGFVIFRDETGKLQRYMPAFKKVWPVEIPVSESWDEV